VSSWQKSTATGTNRSQSALRPRSTRRCCDHRLRPGAHYSLTPRRRRDPTRSRLPRSPHGRHRSRGLGAHPAAGRRFLPQRARRPVRLPALRCALIRTTRSRSPSRASLTTARRTGPPSARPSHPTRRRQRRGHPAQVGRAHHRQQRDPRRLRPRGAGCRRHLTRPRLRTQVRSGRLRGQWHRPGDHRSQERLGDPGAVDGRATPTNLEFLAYAISALTEANANASVIVCHATAWKTRVEDQDADQRVTPPAEVLEQVVRLAKGYARGSRLRGRRPGPGGRGGGAGVGRRRTV
jgi:hypothetical protein